MATNVSERIYRVSVDGASAIKQLEKISGSASSIDQRFAKVGATLKGVFAVGAIVASAKAISSEVLRISESFDQMGKAAQKIGIGAEQLSALKFAAGQSGVSFEALTTGVKKLAVGISDIGNASSETSSLLRQIGVTATDTADSALTKVAKKFSEMPDGIEKTAAATKLFGKAGIELIPLLNEGSEGLEKFTKRAEELGLIMKDSTIAQLTLFNDKLDEIAKAAEGVKIKILEGLAPALAGIAQTVADATTVSDAWVEVGRKLGEVFVQVAIDIEVVLTDIEILTLAIRSIGSLDALKNFSAERQKIVDKSDAFEARLRANVVSASDLGKAANEAASGVGNLGGKLESGPLEKWAEGLKKSAEELDLIPEKMNLLAQAMNTIKERGEEGGNAFKVMAEAYKKLNEDLSKGNVGAEIELQVQKIKDEATLAAEKMEYLGTAIAVAFEQGDTEGAQILIDMMDKLTGKTKDVATDFEKLGEGIEQAIANNANNAVNSFIDNIGSAELSFTDFATSVIKDIAKIVVQLLIMKPIIDSIKGYFGGMGGGEVGWEGGFSSKAFSTGGSFAGGTGLAQGIYNQPTLFKFAKGGTFGGNIGVLGEGSGPEAIVPLKRTASGDLGVQASPVNVNIYNNAGVEVKTESSTSSDGTKQIDVYIERKVKDGIANGSYDRAFKGAYGLSRMGA